MKTLCNQIQKYEKNHCYEEGKGHIEVQVQNPSEVPAFASVIE